MNRLRALLLVLMVTLFALAILPKPAASACSPAGDCSGCCASEENSCTRGCEGRPTCLNNCWTAYMSCISHC